MIPEGATLIPSVRHQGEAERLSVPLQDPVTVPVRVSLGGEDPPRLLRSPDHAGELTVTVDYSR